MTRRKVPPGPLGTGPLTKLDERVMAALDPGKGKRAGHVLYAINHHERRYYIFPLTKLADVRLVLRGLEHLGAATGRGGWWKATR